MDLASRGSRSRRWLRPWVRGRSWRWLCTGRRTTLGRFRARGRHGTWRRHGTGRRTTLGRFRAGGRHGTWRRATLGWFCARGRHGTRRRATLGWFRAWRRHPSWRCSRRWFCTRRRHSSRRWLGWLGVLRTGHTGPQRQHRQQCGLLHDHALLPSRRNTGERCLSRRSDVVKRPAAHP
jgi:hypothetical protein